jgi:NSS family neurotransmitter:Na+ symporter
MAAPAGGTGGTGGRETWATTAGFVLAAVGSAVGLGNMWRFSYATAENGGAAFVLLYIILTLAVGIPVMIAEFGLGRSTRSSPIGALRKAGGRGWSPVGYLFVLAGLLILGYYSVIAGWVTRYAIDAIRSPFPADAGAYFGEVSGSTAALGFHLFFMAAVAFIVSRGVSKGIERASLLMMPVLFLIIVGLAIWAATLAGAGDGYRYYLAPSLDELLSLDTLAGAASQAFFSLSLGMGAMLTFASYLPKDSSLPGEAGVIAFADFGVAFIAGMVVFPIIFALGLQGAVGESTVGALFISLPGAFEAMGPTGRLVGILFFVALFIGALTSGVSLLEVVVASVIDEFGINRKAAALGAGGLIAAIGIAPALSIDVLGAMDAVASDIFLPLGGLCVAILVGWKVAAVNMDAFATGAQPWIRNVMNGWMWTLRIAVPPLLVVVLWQNIPAGIGAIRAIFQ